MVAAICPVEAPTPRWSKVMTCRFFAMASTMRGSQLSRVAARCTKKTTGMAPFGRGDVLTGLNRAVPLFAVAVSESPGVEGSRVCLAVQQREFARGVRGGD